MRQNITTFVVVAALTVALSARAGEFYAKNGISDWSVASNFTTDRAGTTDATTAPGESAGQDTVCIPNGYTVNIASKAARDRVNRLVRIRPFSTTSKIVFTVPANETWTNSCPINYNGEEAISSYYMNGPVLKRGGGTLEFTTAASFYKDTSTGNYNTDYKTQLIAEEGTLILPQGCSVNKRYLFGEIAVSNGATLVSAVDRNTYAYLLSGDGTFTNRVSSTVWVCLLGHSVMVNGVAVPQTRTFSGAIGGNLFFNCAERLMLTGTANTFSTGISPYGNNGAGISGKGVVGAVTLGMQGQPSSIGKSTSINFGQENGPGMLLYLGSGNETCDKSLYINRWSIGASILDAGMNGGVTFTGSWGNPSANADYPRTWGMNYFVLQGSNVANACTFTGAMRSQTYLQTNYVMGIVKDGPGIWKFADSAALRTNTDRLGLGNFVAKDGTLQYASHARRYERCALGLAANMSEMYTGVINTNKVVDWFIALGDASDMSKEGCLEYVGANAVWNHDRPLVMRGNARLRNSTDVKVRYRALAAEGATAKTLTLDGTNTSENEISDVIDTAAAPVSVVKEGSGTWVLGGDTTFHGSLEVKGGSLIVRKYPAKYSWYRWTIKENSITAAASSNTTYVVQCPLLALYDANTNRQNGALSFVGRAYDLQPGQAGYDFSRRYAHDGNDISYLFRDDCRAIEGMKIRLWSAQDPIGSEDFARPVASSPGTWIPIVMRLTNGAPAVASWDYVARYGTGTGSANRSASNRIVKRSSIEGSVDGLHWDNLTGGDKVVEENELPTGDNNWVSGGTKNRAYGNGGAEQHEYGVRGVTQVVAQFPAWDLAKTAPDREFEVLSNCESVSVSGGSLIADGEGIALRSIVADCTASAGTIGGFALPDDFEIEVKNLSGHDATLPVSFVNCTGLANAGGWTVTGIVNGKERAMRASVCGSSVRVSLRGMIVSFR